MTRDEIKSMDLGGRGAQAQALLTNELMIEIRAYVEAQLTKEWINGKTTEDRELAYFQLNGFKMVFAKLESFVIDGKLAAKRAKL